MPFLPRPSLFASAALASLGAFVGLTLGTATARADVPVTVTDKGCEPNTITVPAGSSTFVIQNKSTRLLEWEILNGVMVVDERENIAPGFKQKLTTKLDPGTYDVTCGLLDNPKGKLIVTASAASSAPQKPSALDLVGPIAEYKVYVMGEVDQLVAGTKAFAASVKAGDLAKAKQLYAPTRAHYERIEPIAELFSDLDNNIDSRADDHQKKEQDPGFLGFHRIEYGLWTQNSTKDLGAVADKLVADVLDLQKRLDTLTIPAAKMVGGAADLIEEVAATKSTGEEDRYSHTDLVDFQANVDGAKKITDLLQPLTVKADAALQTKIDANFTAVDAILAKYKTADGGFETYDKVSAQDRLALKGPVNQLAEDLSQLRGALGLN